MFQGLIGLLVNFLFMISNLHLFGFIYTSFFQGLVFSFLLVGRNSATYFLNSFLNFFLLAKLAEPITIVTVKNISRALAIFMLFYIFSSL